ncbi:SPOR domain-containing protein [Aquimarina sp. BL5]|uniref:SPOR domain-containing protein n=3 Tax=Aquimarina sp. BL5 TaxID=1714860 RepID=UPI000E553ADE|nr:SPOR domain-containing protein [Aquimarina sp. BL5]AXT49891.1 SPOR domain-containing protein [Aquimarina sp. BL5]
MPDIKNEDLLSLHYQIEKAEVEQQKLEDLLNDRSLELKKNRASKIMFKILCSVLLITTITLIIYVVFWVGNSSSSVTTNNKEFSSFQSEIDGLKNQLNQLKKEQPDLKNIKDLYLYRSLINKDTVYSVQIQSFTTDKVSLVSEKFTNTLFYNDTYYYKLSLGIFETLEEAQEFRKILLQSGIIDKNIFVISYKEGERIRIENPF